MSILGDYVGASVSTSKLKAYGIAELQRVGMAGTLKLRVRCRVYSFFFRSGPLGGVFRLLGFKVLDFRV